MGLGSLAVDVSLSRIDPGLIEKMLIELLNTDSSSLPRFDGMILCWSKIMHS
jgi:hypothetical protein